jgi:ABC-type uncharacterized transport system ATPase subunit
MEIIKTKQELKAMLAELIMNEYIIVANEDEEYFLNLARKVGILVHGGAITKEGRVFYIEL